VEREAFALGVMAEAIEKGLMADAPFRADLRAFDATPLAGEIDILTGGYPCQPFSVAGRRRGEQDERHLWPEVARIVGECRPAVCFFENVGGHLRLGYWRVWAWAFVRRCGMAVVDRNGAVVEDKPQTVLDLARKYTPVGADCAKCNGTGRVWSTGVDWSHKVCEACSGAWRVGNAEWVIIEEAIRAEEDAK